MSQRTYIVTVLVVALLAGLFEVYVRRLTKVAGTFRSVEPLHNEHCRVVPELEGCEKIVLDEPSGLLYLACVSIEELRHWSPPVLHLDARGKLPEGYIATYDADTGTVTRLELLGKNFTRGLSPHGMDVVRSAAHPAEVFVYAVNHRVPLEGRPEEVGADSVIEIFSGRVGEHALTHVATVVDPLIHTPNDVVGSSDGKSFWISNDRAAKTSSLYYQMELFLAVPTSSVVYCHADEGCKIAADTLVAANGITRSRTNETFYLASPRQGIVYVFEKQVDNTLHMKNVATIGLALDNLSMDREGALWAAVFPKVLLFAIRANDLTTQVPSAGWRITKKPDEESEPGKRYTVERIFEDDGTIVQAATSVVHDARRGLLYIHSMLSTQLAICKM